MSRHSPFAVSTLSAPVAQTGPSFAANWFVTGIARVGDTDFVSIKSRDATVQFSLHGKEPYLEQGVVLESIHWADEAVKSTVSIRKGDELALLQFNEAIVHGPSGAGQSPAAALGTAKGSAAPVRLGVAVAASGVSSGAAPISVATIGTRPMEGTAGPTTHRRIVQIPVPR